MEIFIIIAGIFILVVLVVQLFKLLIKHWGKVLLVLIITGGILFHFGFFNEIIQDINIKVPVSKYTASLSAKFHEYRTVVSKKNDKKESDKNNIEQMGNVKKTPSGISYFLIKLAENITYIRQKTFLSHYSNTQMLLITLMGLTFWLLWRIIERKNLTKPQYILKKNSRKILKVRKKIQQYKDCRQSYYKELFFKDINKYLDNAPVVLSKLPLSNKQSADKIISLYNHNTLILLVKRSIKNVSEEVLKDFLFLNSQLGIPFDNIDGKKKNESLNHILRRLYPIISVYDKYLNTLINKEVAVIKKVNNLFKNNILEKIKSLKKPSLTKKIKYFLLSNSKENDKEELRKLEKQWDDLKYENQLYIEEWNKIKQSNIQVLEVYDKLFSNYLSYLFEECVIGQIINEIETCKTPPNKTIKKLIGAIK